MRTFLIEIEQIENWLLKRGSIQHRLVSEAKWLTSPAFKEKVHWQARTYDMVQLYGREKLYEEIKTVEHQLFHSPKYKSFQDRIRSIFNH